MKTIYLDCSMGAAGDMLTAALYELLSDDEKIKFAEKINNMGLDGVTVTPGESIKCGIKGTYMRVLVDGREEGTGDHDHGHEEHSHEHNHSHAHSSLHDIEHIIDDLNIPDGVKKDAVDVYKLIAEAESHAHGKPVTDIHFHEVGTLDAIADIVSVCILMEMLSPDRVLSSAVNTGSGHVHCAHGILPVPAPATAYILKGIPVFQGHISSELCTPTGAALLKHFASDFCAMPVMKVSGIGYGMGKKDFEQANCVRVFLGEASDADGEVSVITFNVDDMTPETIGFACEALFKEGALEVYTVPAGMKKSRPGTEITVICNTKDKDDIIKQIFKHTTTLGVRERTERRYVLDRKIREVDTKYGPVRLKRSEGYGVIREKWEYDDIAGIAEKTGCPVKQIEDSLNDGLR
ncbi:MAG: nickel pincer cofactor biosynthesis protein LarC [Lachnospiraceae bacterium]|nr:nickel pincer cofactor biosynthesis protein LarC [Lachnospiraceae bacterium]